MNHSEKNDLWNRIIQGGFPSIQFPMDDKQKLIDSYALYNLCRTQSMFRWEGLPDTLPQRNLELMLQLNGNVCIAEYNGNIYGFTGGLGGVPNEYYMPTEYIVANPHLKLNRNYTIGKDCVVIPNDSLYVGLLPMISKYGTLLAENDMTMYIADINSRIPSIILADSDTGKKAADKYISDIKNGELSVVMNQTLFEGIKTAPYAVSGGTRLTELIEYHQYLKASMYNDLGLNANYNMKRESINSNESQLNDDMLLPLIDDMLKQREQGAEAINKMFGTNISVGFASAWEDNAQELEAEQEQIEIQTEVGDKNENTIGSLEE